MKSVRLPLITLLIIVPALHADALDDTLALVGLRRADLGWRPKGWWPRFPHVPYKHRAFDALFNQPLDTITYARTLGETAWQRLDPAELAKQDLGRNSRSLFQATQRLGIDPQFGGFRGYTANNLAPETPLDEAILALYQAAGRDTRAHTFGMKLPYPRIPEELKARADKLDPAVSRILGQLVLHIIEARRWTDLAFRNVDAADRRAVATNYDVGREMIDAHDYRPAMDDVARTWDEASLWYAAQKCVDALDLARLQLQAWQAEHQAAQRRDHASPRFAWETPWGWIRVGGNDADQHDGTATLLLVDLGGNDTYRGNAGGASPTHPISLVLDLAGDDTYQANQQPAQGAGLTGVGVLLDATGNDQYHAHRYAQGVGQFGFGLLADLDGHDTYHHHFSGQGCGYFGVGLLFDVSGDDRYFIWGEGQGMGGPNGVGILADRTGDDHYTAERKHSVTRRPSYHSPDNDVAVSNVQGCGLGRRGDGSDGHSWAGGLGALLDGAGHDHYRAGNWSMGTGYWFGIGLLHDRGGDDHYNGVAYTQGSGAHFCIGALVDEAGNDRHLAEENSHIALAWAHDFTIALLVNIGGDDLYSVDNSGLGFSLNRSVAMLIDTAGDDTYRTRKIERPGHAQNSERFRARGGVATYFADTTSLGLFLDVGGADTYWGDWTDNTHWLDPPDSPNWQDRNFSVGVDRAAGTVDFTPIPVKPPSGREDPQPAMPNPTRTNDPQPPAES